MILCRVHSVSLSPYDAKLVEYPNTPGAVGVCDFAGIVVKVGKRVTRFKEGDRVCPVAFGLNPSDKTAGAFAEYALAVEDLSCHIRDNMSLEVLSSMGRAIATAGLAPFHESRLKLAMCRDGSIHPDLSPLFIVSLAKLCFRT